MSQEYNRDVSSNNRAASSNAASIKYNRYTGGDKVLPVDGCLERFSGVAQVSDGALLNYSAGMEPGILVAFYNNNATTAFIGFQGGSIDFGTVAVDATNGIALRPNDYTVLVLPWETTGVRASVTGVIPYNVKDDSKFVKRS